MRILFLTNHLKGTDGPSTLSLDIIEGLQNLGCDVLCLTSKNSSQNKIKEVLILEEPLKYLANPVISFSTSLKIKREIQRFSPNIIHFIIESYATCLPFLNIKGTKTFLTVHGTYSVIPALFNHFPKKTISNYLSNKFYKKIDRIIAVSFFTKNYLLKHHPELKCKIKVITNGVNLRRHKIIDLKKKPINKVKKILLVGAVKKRKGVLEAIEALKYYHDNFSKNFIYEIIGEYNQSDSYYQKVLRKIKDYNLGDKIFFRGTINDKELKEYYFNAELFLMPSINFNNEFEGFGLVYLEANTKGVPCIGSENCGAEDAILDGKTGYLVDPYNPKEIAKKIDLILNKNTIKGQDCLKWATQNDIKFKARELINFYKTLLNDKRIKLDIGCGKSKKPGFIGIDIDKDSDADIIASALNLPFEDSTVDEVNCSHLVEHFSPEEAKFFFNEIYRVLKKGGIAYLKIDRDWSEKRLLRKDPSHKKRYSVKEIKGMVEKFPFKKVEREIYRFGFHLRNKIFVELRKNIK